MTSVRDIEVPSTDPVARAATVAFGGPIGRYARVGRALPWQPAAAVLTFVASVFVALGMLQKGYCTANGWGAPEVFWRACYSDLPFLFSATPLQGGGYPYPAAGPGLAQPPLTGALMWLMSALVPGGDAFERQRSYVLVWAIVLMAILAALVLVTARSCRRNPWRAAHVACSPLLVTAALVSPDLFGVMLASVALYLWSRRRPELAGALFGLAIAARTYPVLLVLVVGLLAVRAGRLGAWAAMAGTALLSYVGALLAVYVVGVASGGAHGLGDLSGLLAPYRQWGAAGPDYGSLWYLPRLAGLTISPHVAVALAVAGWALALSLGAALALSAPHRPTIAELSLVVVGIVLLTGRSLPVQASLWLLPLVALAGLRWRDHLIWASGEVLYFVAIWLYLGGTSDPARALPLPWLMVFSAVRLAGIAWLVVAAWRSAARRVPVPDPYDDPPAGESSTSGAQAGGVGRRPVVADADAELGGRVVPVVGEQRGEDEPDVPSPDVPAPDVSAPDVSASDVPERDAAASHAWPLELEPDELAGPLAGRPDALTVALR